MQPYNAAPTSQNPAEQCSFHSQLYISILDFLKNGFTSEYPFVFQFSVVNGHNNQYFFIEKAYSEVD